MVSGCRVSHSHRRDGPSVVEVIDLFVRVKHVPGILVKYLGDDVARKSQTLALNPAAVASQASAVAASSQ